MPLDKGHYISVGHTGGYEKDYTPSPPVVQLGISCRSNKILSATFFISFGCLLLFLPYAILDPLTLLLQDKWVGNTSSKVDGL